MAQLPGAGNFFCWASEDHSDLPNGASHHFFYQLADFNSSERCRVTVAVFVRHFNDSDISFLSVIKSTDLTVTTCEWLIKTIKPIRSEHPQQRTG